MSRDVSEKLDLKQYKQTILNKKNHINHKLIKTVFLNCMHNYKIINPITISKIKCHLLDR